jgi:hypothetical protein
MKLEDVKHLIDAYFDKVTPAKVVADFEALGYVFEDIEEEDYPKALIIAEREALKELEEVSVMKSMNENYHLDEITFQEMNDETENITFDFHSKSYDNSNVTNYLKAA